MVYPAGNHTSEFGGVPPHQHGGREKKLILMILMNFPINITVAVISFAM
jgi:hypothetical protein